MSCFVFSCGSCESPSKLFHLDLALPVSLPNRVLALLSRHFSVQTPSATQFQQDLSLQQSQGCSGCGGCQSNALLLSLWHWHCLLGLPHQYRVRSVSVLTGNTCLLPNLLELLEWDYRGGGARINHCFHGRLFCGHHRIKQGSHGSCHSVHPTVGLVLAIFWCSAEAHSSCSLLASESVPPASPRWSWPAAVAFDNSCITLPACTCSHTSGAIIVMHALCNPTAASRDKRRQAGRTGSKAGPSIGLQGVGEFHQWA